MDYILMHKEIQVLAFSVDDDTKAVTDIFQIYNHKHIPIGIQHTKQTADRRAFNHWWLTRSIPASREGIQKLLEVASVTEPTDLLVKCNCLSLSDQYWVRPIKSTVKWKDINFFTNVFSDDIGRLLFSENPNSNLLDFNSPDNTSDGVLKKRWKIINGSRCLLKAGSTHTQREPAQEVLASLILRELGISHVEYNPFLEGNILYTVCSDFINEHTELVSAYRISLALNKLPSDTKYKHFMDCCNYLKIPNITMALNQMIIADYLIDNCDRHFSNFGMVRNATTLDWMYFAPLYDNGNSFGNNYDVSEIIAGKDTLCKTFKKTNKEQLILVTSFSSLSVKRLLGLPELLSNLLHTKEIYPVFSAERVEAILTAFRQRVDNLIQYMEAQPKADKLSMQETMKLFRALEHEGVTSTEWVYWHSVEEAEQLISKYI